MGQRDFYSFYEKKNSCVSNCLPPTHTKKSAYLTDPKNSTWLLKKCALHHKSPTTFVRQWTSIHYSKTTDFLFNVSSKFSTIIDYYEILTNSSLGESFKFLVSSIFIPSNPSSTITTFSEGLSSSIKARAFWK